MLEVIGQLVVRVAILSAGHILFGLGLFSGFFIGLVFFLVIGFVALGDLGRRLLPIRRPMPQSIL